jgi:hypothetical protein
MGLWTLASWVRKEPGRSWEGAGKERGTGKEPGTPNGTWHEKKFEKYLCIYLLI